MLVSRARCMGSSSVMIQCSSRCMHAGKNIAAGTELFMDYGPDFPI